MEAVALIGIDRTGSALTMWARSNSTTGFDLYASRFE
jgi:hypothetical protein